MDDSLKNTADETLVVLCENNYAGTLTRPNNPHVMGRIDLDAGPIVTLYRSGKALLQGRNVAEHGDNIRALLRYCEWKVK